MSSGVAVDVEVQRCLCAMPRDAPLTLLPGTNDTDGAPAAAEGDIKQQDAGGGASGPLWQRDGLHLPGHVHRQPQGLALSRE